MKIPDKEILRYLGYGGSVADEQITQQIRYVSAGLFEYTHPKSIYGIWDCRVTPPVVEIGGIRINSGSLSKHLSGCERVALLAATLGAGTDELIRRYSVREMEKAAVAGAVCAAMIEAYCGQIEEEIMQKPGVSGLHPTARFSPGYGDFDIAHQKDILKLLDCSRKIGLTMTDGYMLVPSKSVTAVIGFSAEKKYVGGKCERCDKELCEFGDF